MCKLSFVLCGQVVRGKQLGSKLGFPTANIAYTSESDDWPKEGVYIGIAELEGNSKRYLAVLNQGKHPTVPEGLPTVEAHLLGYSECALYGQSMKLTYRRFLRNEQAFPSLGALKEQLSRDCEAALHWSSQNEPELSFTANSVTTQGE